MRKKQNLDDERPGEALGLTAHLAAHILPAFQRSSLFILQQARSLESMPNHKSAEKRDRQNKKRNAINSAHRTRLRNQVKKLRTAIAAGDQDQAQSLLAATVSVIDKSIQKGVLHRNAAARHKSRLTQHINELAAK